jgi:hypothetical protein
MYKPRERQIFEYVDGSVDDKGKLKVVWGDPVDLTRRMMKAVIEFGMEDSFQAMKNMADVNAENETEPERKLRYQMTANLHERMVELVREVFRIKPYNADTREGMDDDLALEQFTRFMQYQAELKKNSEMPPSTLPPSAGVPMAMGQRLAEPPTVPNPIDAAFPGFNAASRAYLPNEGVQQSADNGEVFPMRRTSGSGSISRGVKPSPQTR